MPLSRLKEAEMREGEEKTSTLAKRTQTSALWLETHLTVHPSLSLSGSETQSKEEAGDKAGKRRSMREEKGEGGLQLTVQSM